MAHSVDKEQLSALLDDELNDAERDAVLAHLDECADCRAYFAELTALHDALDDMDEIDVPDGFAEGVMSRLHKKKSRAKTRRAWRGWAALAASAAAVALLVNVIPRGASDAAETVAVTAEAPRMTMTASAPAAPAPTEAETAEESAADMESLLETQMLFMSGGAANAPEEAEKAMDALAAMPEAAYDGYVVVENTAAPDDAGAAVERTLYGVGAWAWLTERGWQGESGDWYADADDLRALPEGLALTAPLPDGYSGDVRLNAEEPEIVEEAVEELVEEAVEGAVGEIEAEREALAEEVAP